jgi:hypothetical protein
VNAVRYGPAIFDFAAGLLLLAVGSILVAIAVGRSGMLSRWSGSIFALAFALYIPQFFMTQAEHHPDAQLESAAFWHEPVFACPAVCMTRTNEKGTYALRSKL